MVITITDPEIERQIEAIAARRGGSAADVVVDAVKQLNTSGAAARHRRPTAEEIMKLVRSFPSGPVNYDLSEDEILGYGPNGYSE